jgi:DNA-binding CsgD family transcriptional regulator
MKTTTAARRRNARPGKRSGGVVKNGLSLSERESQIAALVVTGASNKEIARQLEISLQTVKNTLTRVFDKTGTRSRTQLAVWVLRADMG